ncbi:MAG: D-alanyl-D-alanine carboxypeptidase family protein [Cyanobacteria bacterium J06560_2]
MKLFHRIPKPYRGISIGVLSALIMMGSAAFVFVVIPNPQSSEQASEQSSEQASEQASKSESGTDADSGISATPVEPNGVYTPPSVPTVPQPAVPNSAPKPDADPTSPISPEAIAQNPNQPVTAAEPYDDVPTNKFNHFSYDEADPSRIESVGLFERESYEREEFLDYEAAAAFEQMKAAAAAEGISLIPVSGFRTIARQQELFDNQVEKLGSEAAAAALSAPPGHSEHHTGYAIDIGDATMPDTDIKYSFEDTPAYGWLAANAKRYGFEESFPYNNQQGVSFEPWHWRFVGSPRAREVFSYSKILFPGY